nr:putative BTB/POZ domain containing protein [Marseillevirus futianmevirus]
MEGTIRFETCDGKETSVNAKALCEKSPYFKALLSKKWKEGETGVVSLDISQKKAERVFSFALGDSYSLEKKDEEVFSYFFPGTPTLKAKEMLPFTKETCELLFPGSIVFGHTFSRQEFGYFAFRMTGGYIVAQPQEGEVNIKDFICGLGDFYATKKCDGYAGMYKCSASGFLLWCYVVLSKQEEFVEEMYKQTGLVVVPAHHFFSILFDGNYSMHVGGELAFSSKREIFFVSVEGSFEAKVSIFAKYDNTKGKDLPWEHSKKVETLRAGVPLNKGFLVGKLFPQEAEEVFIKFEKM